MTKVSTGKYQATLALKTGGGRGEVRLQVKARDVDGRSQSSNLFPRTDAHVTSRRRPRPPSDPSHRTQPPRPGPRRRPVVDRTGPHRSAPYRS